MNFRWFRRRDQELDDEIQAHLALAARDRVERGEEPHAAQQAALREFGNRALIQETTREVRGWAWAERLAQDVRYALRGMRRSPVFTLVAVVSLALGIGANTAIFSLVNSLMLRTLPVGRPGELVQLLERFEDEPHQNTFSWQSYQYFLAHNHMLSGLTATTTANFDSGGFFNVSSAGGAAERVDGVLVSGSYFPVLGLRPALGRLIGPADDRLESPAAVAVMSWAYWESRYNLDPSVLGRQIEVEGRPVTIAGVAPRGFRGLNLEYQDDLWIPVAAASILRPGSNPMQSHGGAFALVGRLRPGVTLSQAHAEMAVLFRQAVEGEPQSRAKALLSAMKFEMDPAGVGLSRARDQFAQPLVVLMGAVGLLLLVACTNVAGMLLARGVARQRELALRVSLGAGGWRLARQTLTESLVLSIAGTVLGIGLAFPGTKALIQIIASGRDRLTIHVTPDVRTLCFTAGLALVTALLFGILPALRAWRTAPATSLRGAGKAGSTRFQRHFGRGLVAAQVAFSIGLLGVAGLFLNHLANLYGSLGFERGNVLLVTLDASKSGIPRAQLARPYQALLERLQAIPQVRSATLSGVTPVQGAGANRDATVEGYQDTPGALRYLAENWVAPRYFETLGTPLIAGRDFTFDDERLPRVAIVNQAMARHYFGAASPMGKHVIFDGDTRPYEIVGLVGDAKYVDAHEPAPRTIYFNVFQDGVHGSQFSLRTRGAPGAVAASVRRTVEQMLKNVSVRKITTLADQVDANIVPERLIVVLSSLFGVLGGLLAAIGTYGLLAYTVTSRTNEIGVRMALGATQAAISRMVLREALATTGAGLLAGIPLAWWARRLAASVIAGLPASGTMAIAAGAVLMIGIALAAACLPARRAARVDPIEALRYE